jgi:hypothetical protein
MLKKRATDFETRLEFQRKFEELAENSLKNWDVKLSFLFFSDECKVEE